MINLIAIISKYRGKLAWLPVGTTLVIFNRSADYAFSRNNVLLLILDI